METQQNTSKATGIVGWFNTQAANFEERRFAAMCVMLTIQSCLGSIACMYILQNDGSMGLLMTGAAITMGSNSAFIAQAPAKWCLGFFYLSLFVNSILILANF